MKEVQEQTKQQASTEQPLKKNWKAIHKQELVDFVCKFYQTAWNWRESSGYHQKWDRWERNANAIYDPSTKAKKNPWQACMFDPSITPTNVELTTNALVKVLSGKEKPLGVKPREMGDELQAELHSAILDYEVQRSNWLIADYDTTKEAVIYGSGFMKIYWQTKQGMRRVKKPVREALKDALMNFRLPMVTGHKEEIENLIVKNDPVCEKVHIRDIFLEPNSSSLDRVLQRNKNITYGELFNLSKQKNKNGEPMVDPDSVASLRFVTEGPGFDSDLNTIMSDKGIVDSELVRPDFNKKHTTFEYWGPLPRKWVELDLPEDTEEQKNSANEIMPGKALVASGKWFLASEVNPLEDMEPPYIQKDYIRTNQRYGIGVGQLLEGIQDEANEIRNLRADNVNIALNKMFAVIEKFLVDPSELVVATGQVFRFQFKGAEIDDIRKVFMPIEVGDVAISAYRETGDLERKAQETVGNNRVTLGSAGLTKDTNSTLGGMELLKQSSFERFTMYAYIMGCVSNVLAAKKLMGLSYQNRAPEEIQRILGNMPVSGVLNPETGEFETVAKWAAYKPLPPHELEKDYDFIFTDVFKAENKAQKLTAVMNFGQFLSSTLPGYDIRPIVKRAAHYNDFSLEEINSILEGIPPILPTPMGMGQGVPSLTKPTKSFSGGEAAPTPTSNGTMGPGQ